MRLLYIHGDSEIRARLYAHCTPPYTAYRDNHSITRCCSLTPTEMQFQLRKQSINNQMLINWTKGGKVALLTLYRKHLDRDGMLERANIQKLFISYCTVVQSIGMAVYRKYTNKRAVLHSGSSRRLCFAARERASVETYFRK